MMHHLLLGSVLLLHLLLLLLLLLMLVLVLELSQSSGQLTLEGRLGFFHGGLGAS